MPTNRWLFLFLLEACLSLPCKSAVAKPGAYQLADEQRPLQTETPSKKEALSFAAIANGVTAYLTAPEAIVSSRFMVFASIIGVVAFLTCGACMTWANRQNDGEFVSSATGGWFPARHQRSAKDGRASQAGSTKTALPAFLPAPGKVQQRNQETKWEDEHDEATLYRHWDDPRSQEDAEQAVHFLKAPTFDSPPGVLSSKEVKGTPAGWPRPDNPAHIARYTPQISPASRKNAYLVKKGVAEPTGA